MGGSLFMITFPLTPSERSLPLPHYLTWYILFLLIYQPPIYSPPCPLHYSPPHMNALPVFHTYLNSTCIFAFPFTFFPSKQFSPWPWDLNTCLNSRNGISNNVCIVHPLVIAHSHKETPYWNNSIINSIPCIKKKNSSYGPSPHYKPYPTLPRCW